ncbi:MAG: bifunctional diaminohydroxyphosphoribosylaminopyrimidine deaminase/5-amino-6-(5-phosphoribosylamino)uracil reductase RibD [Lentisphaeraceae bacterium]|nr:bifunctional diaminohydroxyphosphoribosylaminopyrimidine deaminase/5-amino-6-(5-phosphoribosylamino)uracil reductase RibD [Lentisphaeraceae bacterium]
MNTHEKWMSLACDEALKAFGQTSPNPLVGAVATKNGELLSKGYHHKAGQAHAEVDCLKDSIDYTDAELYVTLEPCSTHGRTPPCTKKIISRGIKKVYIGTLDPNPDHAGQAVDILQSKGIDVEYNILPERCWKINLPFFKWIVHQQPYVTLKMAMTLDGKIATEEGLSKWITGPASRDKVQHLRKWCDAIMVGGETILKDDSGLKVLDKNWQQPQRYIWTSKTNLPHDSKVFQEEGALLNKPTTNLEWSSFLNELGKQNITSLLLEGGGELAANALTSNAVDEIKFFIAPKILTGRNSRTVTGGDSPQSLDEAINVLDWETEASGSDICITGYLNNFHKLQK